MKYLQKIKKKERRKYEVADLQAPIVADEEVLALQVSVDDVARVKVPGVVHHRLRGGPNGKQQKKLSQKGHTHTCGRERRTKKNEGTRTPWRKRCRAQD